MPHKITYKKCYPLDRWKVFKKTLYVLVLLGACTLNTSFISSAPGDLVFYSDGIHSIQIFRTFDYPYPIEILWCEIGPNEKCIKTNLKPGRYFTHTYVLQDGAWLSTGYGKPKVKSNVTREFRPIEVVPGRKIVYSITSNPK